MYVYEYVCVLVCVCVCAYGCVCVCVCVCVLVFLTREMKIHICVLMCKVYKYVLCIWCTNMYSQQDTDAVK